MSCVSSSPTRFHSSYVSGTPAVLHEKQKGNLCAQHVLNNLLQRKAFTERSLDRICGKLTPTSFLGVNPHKAHAIFGGGNYDINVIETALHNEGYEMRWLHHNEDIRTIPLEGYLGIVVNSRVDGKRHWFGIAHIRGSFYNVDSLLDEPHRFESRDRLNQHICDLQRATHTHVLLVYARDPTQPSHTPMSSSPPSRSSASPVDFAPLSPPAFIPSLPSNHSFQSESMSLRDSAPSTPYLAMPTTPSFQTPNDSFDETQAHCVDPTTSCSFFYF